jgi:hypothetical protein
MAGTTRREFEQRPELLFASTDGFLGPLAIETVANHADHDAAVGRLYPSRHKVDREFASVFPPAK